MKKVLSLALALALLWACLPVISASAPSGPSSWEAVEAVEARAAAGLSEQNAAARTAAYAGAAKEMILTVQRAWDYVPGTLERHGDFFFWQTTDGRANGWSPSLRAEIQAGDAGGSVSTLGTQTPSPAADPANTAADRSVGVFIPYSDSY